MQATSQALRNKQLHCVLQLWQFCSTQASAQHVHDLPVLMQMWPEGLSGIEVKVDGFSHKLPLLVDYIFKQLVSLTVEPDKFDRIREGLVRRYKNANFKPDKHATYLRVYAIKQSMWAVEDVQAQLEALTPSAVQGVNTQPVKFWSRSSRMHALLRKHLPTQCGACCCESTGLRICQNACRTALKHPHVVCHMGLLCYCNCMVPEYFTLPLLQPVQASCTSSRVRQACVHRLGM